MSGKPKILHRTNYLSFISLLPGSKPWQHLFVSIDGKKIDAMDNGDKSCAYMVSSVLTIFGLTTKPHATIVSTINDMKKNGWIETTLPSEGAVVEWDGHIGFFMNDREAISNSSMDKSVARHPLMMTDGREPTRYWNHKVIESDNTVERDVRKDPILPNLKKGVYRHNKSRCLYEVTAVTFNTETNEPLVLYKPLYESKYEIFARPYDMFVEQVTLDGKLVPRFEKTND